MDEHALAQGRTFTWHELYTPDVDGSRSFYSKALGWETEDMPMGDAGTYPMMKANGSGVCGVMGTNTPEMEGVPPHWSVYIAVDDVDARLQRCLDLGAKVVTGPMEVPTVGRFVLIQDPHGAHVWLFKSANG